MERLENTMEDVTVPGLEAKANTKTITATKSSMQHADKPDIKDLARDSEPIDPNEPVQNDLGVIGQQARKLTPREYPFCTVSKSQGFFDALESKPGFRWENVLNNSVKEENAFKDFLEEAKLMLEDIGYEYEIVRAEECPEVPVKIGLEAECKEVFDEVELLRAKLRQLQITCLTKEMGVRSSALLEVAKEILHYFIKLDAIDDYLDMMVENPDWEASPCTWASMRYLFNQISQGCYGIILDPEYRFLEDQAALDLRHPLELFQMCAKTVKSQQQRIHLLWNILRENLDRIERHRFQSSKISQNRDLEITIGCVRLLRKALKTLAIFESINNLFKEFREKVHRIQSNAAIIEFTQKVQKANGCEYKQTSRSVQEARQLVVEILKRPGPNTSWIGVIQSPWQGNQLPISFWEEVENKILKLRDVDKD
ncbi:hypothetical protein TWF506_009744 [Arthrobotrys conoides]|uniref:Uncharacterized protein n=1 Tax=Arthrobotrys conoides TaxID=74498 RepID=A0AAN8RWK8_9PEZI